jgi:hypothetical protein
MSERELRELKETTPTRGISITLTVDLTAPMLAEALRRVKARGLPSVHVMLQAELDQMIARDYESVKE